MKQKKVEIKLKIIMNEELINAIKNYETAIIEQCNEKDQKNYYEERKNNIVSGITETDEIKEIENYIASKSGFNGIAGEYYCNWKKN